MESVPDDSVTPTTSLTRLSRFPEIQLLPTPDFHTWAVVMSCRPMLPNDSNDIRQEEIQQLARLIWEGEGRPEGRSLEHWIRAEEQLRAEKQAKRRRKQNRSATVA
jgi:hypothetical protein